MHATTKKYAKVNCTDLVKTLVHTSTVLSRAEKADGVNIRVTYAKDIDMDEELYESTCSSI